MNMFNGFWFGVWILFLAIVAFIPCMILAGLRSVFKKESFRYCMEHYMEKWFQFIDKI